eukprot:Skav207483  [mRNA]  locus=scaffold2519:36542:38800:- [translate_table: standard]
MVILESAAATAAAGMAPGAAAKVYEYNRDNFMEDREQRMKKEFHERRYRVVQGQLWRQDVRDFISLTEQKMSLYLIINVLLLSFTVTMWVEGQLPETTPDWSTEVWPQTHGVSSNEEFFGQPKVSSSHTLLIEPQGDNIYELNTYSGAEADEVK